METTSSCRIQANRFIFFDNFNKMFTPYLIAGIVFFFTPFLRAQADQPPSLQDKVAQLIIISIDASGVSAAKSPVAHGLGGIQLQWGSYSLEDTRSITEELQRAALKSGPRIPLFIATDYEGGSVYAPTTLGLAELPTNMMLGAADDENNTASLFYLAGKELKRAGINMIFGPVLDVNTNPGNPIIGVRAISGSPGLVSKIGAAVINGLRAGGILPIVKHFPGHGAAGQDSHKLLPVIGLSQASLEAYHLPPFEKAIELNVPAIMTAHVLYPALDPENPASLSKAIIMDLLKIKLGFAGLVITDSLDMKAITSKRPAHKAAAMALKAGADMILLRAKDFRKVRDEIVRQVKTGLINETRINDAYHRVYEAKRAAGLFEAQPPSSAFDKAYVSIAETLSREAVTISSDRNKLLPLAGKAPRTGIIIFAPMRFAENALSLYRVLAGQGYDVKQSVFEINPDEASIAKALEAAGAADRLIIGSFQWAQAQNKSQRRAIKKLLATGKPAVIISLMSPYDLSNYPEAGAALAVYGMTSPGMAAAGEALAGRIQPRGKLPVRLK